VQLIDIRADERKKVINLFFQNFFDGLGTAFFYAMALFIFLNGADHHESLHLYPYVFLISGILIILFAPIYDRIENKSRTDYLIFGLGIFVLLLVFLSYFLLVGTVDKYTGIALLIMHQIIYYFRQTQFWGLSAISFDVLQSKRLFSIVSAGDLPAKFLGYVLIFSLLESGTIQPAQLIFFAAGAYLVSFYFLNNVFKSDHNLRHGSHQHFYSHVETLSFFGNRLIRSLFILGFFIMIVVFVTDYAFTKIVMHKIHDEDIDVYKLVSTILYVSYGIASVLKLFVTSKVYQKLGLRAMLIATPILIILLISFTFFLSQNSADPNWYYSRMFIFIFISFLIFRDVFQKPIFLSLFQPLSNKLRLKGHTLIKGMAEPLGLVVGSGALLIYYQYFKEYDLAVFGLVLFIPLIFWIISAYKVKEIYAETLLNVINRKLLFGNKMLLLDEGLKRSMLEKLFSENESEIIFALSHLKNIKHTPDSYLHLFEHASLNVKLAVWETLFETRQANEIIEFISKFLGESQQAEINYRVYYLLGKSIQKKDEFSGFIESIQPELLEPFLQGWAENTHYQELGSFNTKLSKWLEDNDISRRLTALRLLKFIYLPEAKKILLDALASSDINVKKNAIVGAFGYLDEEIFEKLTPLLIQPEYSKLVKKEMINAGDRLVQLALPYISDSESKMNIRLVQVISQVDSDYSINECVNLLQFQNPEIRNLLLQGLRKTNKQTLQYFKPEFAKQMHLELDLAQETARIMQTEKAKQIFRQELDAVMRRIFTLLALTHEKEIIQRAENGYFSNDSVLRSTSIEAMNLHLEPSIFRKLKTIIDYLDNPARIPYFTYDESVFHFVEKHKRYNQWTIALILINYKDLKTKLKEELIIRNCPIINEQLNSSNMNENDKLKILERVITLKKTSLFSSTAEHVLVDIATLAKEHRYEKGVTLFKKGDKGTSMYIIHSGSVKIHDNSKELAVLKENNFFGELAMLETESRSADATTASDSMLLSIDQDAIYEIMEDRTEVAKGIITVLCQRIRALNEKFVAEKSIKAEA